ncbi:hypothetical protein A3A39_04095 [Candidatus Kaiserbacteria bacterium RIFCSPLOWO2_01_FULL_54_13]|uniref:Kazal-like domain-containing protein n=1 Tax=Candidatus Kaiserbacteria bacterium RIFCSPLOWO2_01_FULL_54_13 TaxID=1798512 RepID=A0A1F6F464_9BACT|nr:MAG: hypothetical protein A3A39_04095 [Candidatus Kaiserbacteria bacterium RIFCSPLOWO2_01_FULL_54_13]
MSNLPTTTLIGIAVVLVVIGALLIAFAQNTQEGQLLSITNFDECAAAGYPIMESYPEQCATPDGRTFFKDRQNLDDSSMTFNGCAVAGCSGQLCVSAEEAAEVITTCEYRAEYACYREASCEPQADGMCGWTQTLELQSCLANPPAIDSSEPQVF